MPSRTFYRWVFGGRASVFQTSRMGANNIIATRRARLRQVIDERFGGKQAKFVEKTGINAGELSGLLRIKHFGEKKARSLEAMLELPNLWLDGLDEKTGMDTIVSEFAWVYSNASEEGKDYLRKTIQAARMFIEQDRRKENLPVEEDRRRVA